MKPYLVPEVNERTHREAEKVLLDVNQSLSTTMAPMAKQVARKVIVTLEPIVAKHNETNQALGGILYSKSLTRGIKPCLNKGSRVSH